MTQLARGRLLLLAGGGIGLMTGMWSGLARAGVHRPVGPMMEHGLLMVLGFLGTLIALERAVALRRRWPYAAPVATSVATLAILVGVPPPLPGLLLTGAGTVLVAAYLVLLRVRVTADLVLMAMGAVAWVGAAALWTAGWSAPALGPMLAAFLVLTILGERLELSRLRVPSGRAQRPVLVLAAVFAVGVALSPTQRVVGLVVGGVALVALTAWFWRYDLARATVRSVGVTRFAAVCMLTGYVWLGVSGVLWVGLGLGIGPGLVYDAALHSLFLGFVISMVMGHAPIILPAVLRVPLPYTRVAWVPLALLHLSVAARVGADLAGSTWARGWTVHGNTTALLLFVAVSAATAIRARRRGSGIGGLEGTAASAGGGPARRTQPAR